jgi:outer membrane protein assembly factor BamB
VRWRAANTGLGRITDELVVRKNIMAEAALAFESMARSAALTLPLLLAVAAQAEDWPQWRGPKRDGVWNETGIRDTFPAGGLKIQWRTPVGQGFSSPVVARGRVYVTDCQLERPKARERVLCFEAATGKRLWTHAYEVNYSDWAFVPGQGGGPSATPIIEAGRVYAIGGSGEVYGLDARNGKVIWGKNLGKEYEVRELMCRASPLIEGNFLILFPGGKPGACVVALDKRSGKEIWKALDESVSNSSPLVIARGGKRQLIVWTGESGTSLNPKTGKLYWREPMVTSNNDAISSPVFHGRLLLIGGLMFKLSADKPAATVLWPESRAVSKRVLSNTSTALLQGDYVYSARSSGELVCLEAATGRQVWGTNKVTDLNNGASIHLTPNRHVVFLYTDRGELICARLTPRGYDELGRTPLVEPTTPSFGKKMAWPPPCFASRHVFARNDRELVCASLAAKP